MRLRGVNRMWEHWWLDQGDWLTEFESAYSGAESFIRDRPDQVAGLLRDLDKLFTLDDEAARDAAMTASGIERDGLGPEPGALDEFLLALRDRCRRHLSGDDSRPLLDPPGDDDPYPPYLADELSEEQEAYVLQRALDLHGDRVLAQERQGRGATPVLRVPAPELAAGAVVALTGERVAAPVGCVVIHHRRSFGQEWSEVRVWVEPERAAPPPWPALQLLFGSYYRPTWRRDWSRSHLPPLDFRREQPKGVADQAREELTHLWELPDESARRGAVLELGSYQVPLLDRRVDRLLISIGWQLETLGDWP